MKNYLLAVTTGVFLLLHTAVSSASIVDVAISGTYSQGGVADLTATTVSLGGAGSFTLDPGSAGSYFDFKLPGTGTFSTIATSIGGYFFLDSYAAGETIGASTFGSQVSVGDDWDTILVADSTAGVWGSTHVGYLGFMTTDSLYGWIEYAFDRTDLTSTISFLSAAYNDVAGGDIVAGGVSVSAVPVPAAAWLFGSALLGFFGFSRKKATVA